MSFPREVTIIDNLVDSIRYHYGKVVEFDSLLVIARNDLETKNIPYDPNGLVFFGTGDPTVGESVTSHHITKSQYVFNISREGPNIVWARSAAIICIFESWEHVARNAIAKYMNRERTKITRPVWGDLRNLRNACAHGDRKLRKQLEVFDFFDVGNVVDFSGEQFEIVTNCLLADCEEMALDIFGVYRKYPFKQTLI
ncbi:hypothetical protein SAMN04488103_101506 [Gemmobacter aquatilis]|uniref:Uncharacterized protein n=1 Tax=Gemmobacter aquatilis TaxID=933059 RepID=A0A1H7ZFC7_9RHOB|nr:hypothetical protein [Gemmobacter aquatilis]SEM56951.1 hypothetical protein SAMN04488103_101506 [Gemmobacter aquatilis]